MKPLHLASLVFVSCHGNPSRHPAQEAKSNMASMEKAATPAGCTTRQCLEQNDGQVIDVEGAYVFPKQRAFAVSKLVLKDGTTIVLSPPENELRDQFASENDGMTMRIRGRIFTGPIPKRYRIIGRTAEPHLLELENIEKLGR